MRRILCIAAVSLLLAPLAAAHDDDPKVLDKLPHYAGNGFRAAWASYPGLVVQQRQQQAATDLSGAAGIDPQGGKALAALGPDTTFTPPISFTSNGVQLLSWVTLAELDDQATSGNDCWGYVSGSGREYALIGTSNSTAFVEITQPDDAQLIATIPGPTSLWRDIKTYQDHAYSVSEGGGGIQVFDLSQIDSGIVTHVGDVIDGTTSASHNVLIDEVSGFLYRAGGGSHGLRIYSLANKANPVFVNSWDDRYVHDAQVVTYTSGPNAGKQIVFASAGGFSSAVVDVLDVTNKNNIQVLDTFAYPNSAYSHQCWLNEDRTLLYLNDELDEGNGVPTTTFVLNVSNLNNVSLAGVFDNNNTAIGHNLYIDGGLLYEANYRSGLRVFDIDANPTNPPETAWFDVFPQDDDSSFNGLWNVYPFFPSGTVIGSDLEKGLFVWRLGAPTLAIAETQALPDILDPMGFSFGVTITEDAPGDLMTGTEQLHYDIGQGWTSVPLLPLGGDNFQADLPPMPCGLEIPYYVSALDSDGITWTGPSVASGVTWRGQAADGRLTALANDMESNQGWTAGAPGDDATTGLWERGNPIGTDAQPENDHSPIGSQCWFTGQGAGGSVGENDVDGGTTTLLSPVLDLSDLVEPNISYWRWYVNTVANAPDADDAFVIDISNDGGANWVNVETLDPIVHEQEGAWIQSVFRVADYVTPTSQVRMRFIASDLNNGSIVEAGIDDFQVLEVMCGDCDDDGVSNGFEILAGRVDRDGNGVPDICELPGHTRGDVLQGGGAGTPGTATTGGPGPNLASPPLPPLLSTLVPELSLSDGGEHNLRLEAGPSFGGKPYLVLGSFSGTSPGFALPHHTVPLQFDGYTRLSLRAPNTDPLVSSQGVLDASGHALAAFTLPTGSDPALAGLVVYHAFLVFDDVVDQGRVILVSNPTAVQLVP